MGWPSGARARTLVCVVRRVALLGLAVFAGGVAHARQALWSEPGAFALAGEPASVEILRGDEPLRSRPDASAPRRGSAARAARVPFYGTARGPGCRGLWLSVGPLAWVCQDHVRLSTSLPLGPEPVAQLLPDGLPLRYHFVGRDGSLGYDSLSLAELGEPDAELQPGFALAIVRTDRSPGGDPFGLTTKGLWVPLRDLGPVQPFRFHGEELHEGRLDTGWVVNASAPVFRRPNGTRSGGHRAQFEAFRVEEISTRLGRRWFRIGKDEWLSDHDARVPTAAPPPDELLPGERWIDVDVKTQVLVAYEGERAVFATLASTGTGKPPSELATPLGVHRIWVKLRTSDMTNLENDQASRYYAIEEVPWVMFFQKGYGLHGTFWHRDFGNVHSHGCVNLAPLDAERMFHFAHPRLPAGWTAALPTDYEPGTIVRVR